MTPWLRTLHQDERGQLQAIPAILNVLAKVGAAAGGIAAGVSAYRSLTETQYEAPRQQLTQAYGYSYPSTSTALVPRTRTELERRQAAQMIYGPSGEVIGFRKRRHMNPLNPRALRRALRRAEAFDRFASRVGRFTRPGTKYRLKIRRRKRR